MVVEHLWRCSSQKESATFGLERALGDSSLGSIMGRGGKAFRGEASCCSRKLGLVMQPQWEKQIA